MSQPPWEPPPDPDRPPQPDPYRTPPPGSYSPPGAHPAGPRRFVGKLVWAGIGLELLYIVVAAFLTALIARLPGAGGIAGLIGALLALAPLIGGIGLAAVGRTTTWRSLGLGFAIGWAVWLIVGAGTCVALVLAYGLGN